MVEDGLAKDPDICIPLPFILEAISPDKTEELFPKADFYWVILPGLVGCLGFECSWS